MRAIMRKEMQHLWTVGAALIGIAVLCFLLSGCDTPGYKPHRVGLGTDSTSGRSADTQASFASEGVRTGGTTPTTTSAGTSPASSTTSTLSSFSDGEAAFRSGQYADAVGVFSAYTARKPENFFGHYMLGLAAWKTGDLLRADSELTRATQLDSTKVKGWLNLARVLLDEKEAGTALDEVERAVSIDSTSGEAYRMLGRVKSELGDVDGAVDAYRRAIVLDDRDVWALNDLGVLLIQKDRASEAVGPLARAIVVKPGSARFHNNLGMALEHVGYYAAAADEYRTAVGIDSTHTKAQANLGRVDGRKDKDGLATLDLSAVAEQFLDNLGGKKTDF